MQVARTVTVIPARENIYKDIIDNQPIKKKVAAYARVSTDLEEQITSYEAQRDYYEKYIKSKTEWEFVKIYTDEGISATSTKKRDGFNQMISDALEGKIDLIITKSVSRFARNTVDTLSTVRQLKEKGVEVYFEKENIYTMDSKGELLITIMSSLAQEESRSISENVTWGQRKRFADGKVSLPYKRFLGYEKGEDGIPKIVEKEAAVVRKIYRMFLEGKTPSGIAKQLTEDSIPTPGGKKKWQSSTVQSILQNEKYKGDALLQKVYTVDFLTKKKKVNEGEVPQYYVENSHPSHIEPETFDLVQYEMKKRKEAKGYKTGGSCFSGKIVCSECGSFYGSKVWHSNSKYKRTIWQCNHKFKNKKKCSTPHIYEDKIKDAFIQAFNSLIENKEEIIEGYGDIIKELLDTSKVDKHSTTIQNEMEVVEELLRKMVEENSRKVMDQKEYSQRYNELVERYKNAQDELNEIEEKLQEDKVRKDSINAFIEKFKIQETILTEFDEELWNGLIENVIVCKNVIRFIFRDGTIENCVI